MLSISELLATSTGIFRDVLENEEIILEPKTTANDIEEWDSLTHIQLIVALEKAYKIRFTTAEITGYKNVGELMEGIQKKLAAQEGN